MNNAIELTFYGIREENKTMLSVGELKEITESLEREYGSDTNVIIQFYNEDGSLNKGDYCTGFCNDKSGNLFLLNHKFKQGNCL